MFATSSGVGIGTTGVSSPLHIVGNSAANFLKGGIRINDTNNSSDFFLGGVASGGFQIAEAAGSTRVIVASGGQLLVGVTSANANGGVLQLKSGITFPATAVTATDANTLDDYEEGTWTAQIQTESGTNWTITSQNCKYIKIGKIVYVEASIAYSAKGSGQLSLATLPFDSTGDIRLYGANSRSSDFNIRTMYFTSYSTYAVLFKWMDSAGFAYYFTNTSEFASVGNIAFAGCYQAAS